MHLMTVAPKINKLYGSAPNNSIAYPHATTDIKAMELAIET